MERWAALPASPAHSRGLGGPGWERAAAVSIPTLYFLSSCQGFSVPISDNWIFPSSSSAETVWLTPPHNTLPPPSCPRPYTLITHLASSFPTSLPSFLLPHKSYCFWEQAAHMHTLSLLPGGLFQLCEAWERRVRKCFLHLCLKHQSKDAPECCQQLLLDLHAQECKWNKATICLPLDPYEIARLTRMCVPTQHVQVLV